MRTDIHHLIIDLKAAIAIERPESIQIALNGLKAFPEVASNQRLSTSFVKQNLIPIGKILGGDKVTLTFLISLLNDPYAAIRAIAAVSLAVRFSNDPTSSQNTLEQAGLDDRKEVREALALGLSEVAASQSKNVFKLCRSWVEHPSPKLRTIALRVLPVLSKQDIRALQPMIYRLANMPDKNVKKIVANALIAIANRGHALIVLDILEDLALMPSQDPWLISRVLSSSWAIEHSIRALEIAKRLESKIGRTREIKNIQKALQDHLNDT